MAKNGEKMAMANSTFSFVKFAISPLPPPRAPQKSTIYDEVNLNLTALLNSFIIIVVVSKELKNLLALIWLHRPGKSPLRFPGRKIESINFTISS